jgi:hypothetical protein
VGQRTKPLALHDARLLDLVSRLKAAPSEQADGTENEFNLCERPAGAIAAPRRLNDAAA